MGYSPYFRADKVEEDFLKLNELLNEMVYWAVLHETCVDDFRHFFMEEFDMRNWENDEENGEPLGIDEYFENVDEPADFVKLLWCCISSAMAAQWGKDFDEVLSELREDFGV